MMTRNEINAILDRVRTWPEERQEDAAQMLLALEENGSAVYRLDADERADIDAALREDERGEVASDEDVEAVFNRLIRPA
jgi:hypothetical protein